MFGGFGRFGEVEGNGGGGFDEVSEVFPVLAIDDLVIEPLEIGNVFDA